MAEHQFVLMNKVCPGKWMYKKVEGVCDAEEYVECFGDGYEGVDPFF